MVYNFQDWSLQWEIHATIVTLWDLFEILHTSSSHLGSMDFELCIQQLSEDLGRDMDGVRQRDEKELSNILK